MFDRKQAELLKVNLALLGGENKDNEIVSIPGLRGERTKRNFIKISKSFMHVWLKL
jgi:hypothetical protein